MSIDVAFARYGMCMLGLAARSRAHTSHAEAAGFDLGIHPVSDNMELVFVTELLDLFEGPPGSEPQIEGTGTYSQVPTTRPLLFSGSSGTVAGMSMMLGQGVASLERRWERLVFVAVVAMATEALGCSSSEPSGPATPTCVPGSSAPCSCTSGNAGAQTCENGTFGPCVCEADSENSGNAVAAVPQPPNALAVDVRAVDWRNRSYLRDGEWMQVREGRARYTDGDGYLVTASMSIPVVYGDLTGDGSDEAAVPIAVATVLDERRGATATTLEVRVYSSVARPARPTEPDFLGSLRLSDHELVVQQVSIRNGHLVLRGAAGLQPAERSYALHGREFVVVE